MINEDENVYSQTRTQVATAGTVTNHLRRISWSSVFAGVLIAIVIQITLSLLGLGIGLSSIDPKTEENPANGIGLGSAIWYVVSSLIAIFLGGWVSGRLAASEKTFDGAIHGVLTWSLLTLLMLYFITSTIGNLIGGASRIVGSTLSAAGAVAGTGIAAAAPAIKDEMKDQDFDVDNLKRQARSMLRQTGKPALQPDNLSNQVSAVRTSVKNTADDISMNPGEAEQETDGFFDNLLGGGKMLSSEVDKEAVVNVIVARTGKTREEANQVADNWIATAKRTSAKWEQAKKDAEVKARDVADKAAHGASMAAILTFVSLLLGCVVAAFAAVRGTKSARLFQTAYRQNASLA